MRTNEQFKQEIIKRAEKYKKERLKKRKKIICSLSVAVVCITALAAAIPAASNKVQKESASAKSSADSSSALVKSGYTAMASPTYKENTAIASEIGGAGNTESAEVKYFAEIITDETASYTNDKDLVSAIYTAVNNIPETADTKESAYESVTNGEIYEITIVYEGVENKYYFNGSAIKGGESDWVNISESAASKLKEVIDKII